MTRFNPRSASSRGAMASPWFARACLTSFQSALRVFTRSDTTTAGRSQHAEPVSIRAPRLHAERFRTGRKSSGIKTVSIRAPRLHAERSRRQARWSNTSCFNPRSASSRGAIFQHRPNNRRPARFNPRSASSRGAIFDQWSEVGGALFQSALRVFTRSDLRPMVGGGWRIVSIRAPRLHAERSSSPMNSSRRGSFNPRSASSRGAI